MKPDRKTPTANEISTTPVLISGAPRSGASIVAEAFAAAGVFIGHDIGQADNKQRLGHLTDHQLAHCHQQHWNEPAGFARSADQLMARWPVKQPWGWSDWRACRFLDQWHALYPHAQWLFVLRRPVELAWAAAAVSRPDSSPGRRVAEAMKLWLECNRHIKAFAERNPEQCPVILLPDDLGRLSDELKPRLPETWSSTLSGLDMQANYNPRLLRSGAPKWVRLRVSANREVARLWSDLQAFRPTGAVSAGSTRIQPKETKDKTRVTMISGHRNAFSETFIQAQLDGLPASTDWLIQDRTGRHFTADEIPLCSTVQRIRQGVGESLGYNDSKYNEAALKRYLRQNQPAVVLAQFGPIAVRVMNACDHAGVPLVVHFHGYDVSMKHVLEEYREDYTRLFDQAAACIVVSRDMEQQLLALGAKPEKVHYNPCSVDMTEFGGADPACAAPVFMATGRYVNKKAPHLTLMAFARVLQACPEARLVMVGDGLLRPACEDLAQCLGIAEAVDFHGFLPHALVARMMVGMRGFIQHSVTAKNGDAEGTPVSLIEAAASGLPVLATRHAGIKQAVEHERTGFLVAPRDVEAMAEYWIRLAREPQLAGRLGAAGQAFISQSPFERNRALTRLWDILQQAMQANS